MNRDYNAEDTRAFASETNDLDPNQIDYIDYINDGGYNEYYRWTNWKRESRIKLKCLLVSSSRKMVK